MRKKPLKETDEIKTSSSKFDQKYLTRLHKIESFKVCKKKSPNNVNCIFQIVLSLHYIDFLEIPNQSRKMFKESGNL